MKTASDDQPEGNKRGAAVTQKTVEAYRALFDGRGDKTTAEIVLADLAVFSRFYNVTPGNASDGVRAYNEGGRRVFLRIHEILCMSESELAGLYEAARRESSRGDIEI